MHNRDGQVVGGCTHRGPTQEGMQVVARADDPTLKNPSDGGNRSDCVSPDAVGGSGSARGRPPGADPDPPACMSSELSFDLSPPAYAALACLTNPGIADGRSATVTPTAVSAAIFSAAVPDPPEMIAPA